MIKHDKMLIVFRKYILKLLYVFIVVFIIISGNRKENNIINNNNISKSVLSSRIENIIDNYRIVKNVQEIKKYGNNQKLEFVGTLTGYGPDCKGCIGEVYCAPNPNVTNGNIYFDDSKYGHIRILAADYSIPCGSIIKISNYPFIKEDFYGIVLDRGSSIVGLTMDLLYQSERETVIIGRTYNIKFVIERWGW